MSWFQPGSLEPLYKYELLGLLVSLAVYNGLTLPFTFPLAFYRKLLQWPIDILQDIEDGWPELAKGLGALQEWPGDDVEEVFSRSFVFSADVFGTVVDVNMAKAHRAHHTRRDSDEDTGNDSVTFTQAAVMIPEPTQNGTSEEKNEPIIVEDKATTNSSASPSDEARSTRSSVSSSAASSSNTTPPFRKSRHHQPDARNTPTPDPTIMVNNSNRHDYIRSYIAHLTTHSIAPQYTAFEAGFFTCLSRLSISLFSAEQLKHLIEGLPDISVPSLETVTKYEGGFHAHHPTIRNFWTVVRSWSQE